jgi:hypothetical protein
MRLHAIVRAVNRKSLHFTFMPGNSVWSVGRLARKTGLSRQRIWQLARGGWLPAKRLPGKQHRFRESPALIAWINQKARQSAQRRKGGDPLARSSRSRRKRSRLKGDAWNEPAYHHLTWVNEFNRWDNRVRHGLTKFDLHRFDWDIEPMICRIIEICGRDWMASLLRRRFTTPQTERSSLNALAE